MSGRRDDGSKRALAAVVVLELASLSCADRFATGDGAVDVDSVRGTDANADSPEGAAPIDASAACGDDPGATRAEIASTPRADAELEFLALAIGSRIAAEQVTYERVVRDVSTIRAAHPNLADLHVRPPYSQDALVVVDETTGAGIADGNYRGLDCSNAYYGARVESTKAWSVALAFKGLYRVDRLACRYLTASGVTQVQRAKLPATAIGDGPKLFAWREADVFFYVFDHAGGDCPSGCMTHDAYEFRTMPEGGFTLVATYKGELPSSTPPAWVTRQWYELDDCYTH